jgi:hypothetical protein
MQITVKVCFAVTRKLIVYMTNIALFKAFPWKILRINESARNKTRKIIPKPSLQSCYVTLQNLWVTVI